MDVPTFTTKLCTIDSIQSEGPDFRIGFRFLALEIYYLLGFRHPHRSDDSLAIPQLAYFVRCRRHQFHLDSGNILSSSSNHGPQPRRTSDSDGGDYSRYDAQWRNGEDYMIQPAHYSPHVRWGSNIINMGTQPDWLMN